MRKLKQKMPKAPALGLALLALLVASTASPARGQDSGPKRLPTGQHLDPSGDTVTLGSMPLAMSLAPGGGKIVVSLGGWREQGIQVVDLMTRRVEQTLKQEAAFLGLA